MSQGEGIYTRSPSGCALRQSEILSNLTQVHLLVDSLGLQSKPQMAPRVHSWAMVVSQDCDLDQDYKGRFERDSHPSKDFPLIPNILFCEVFLAIVVRWGGEGVEKVQSPVWSSIKGNAHPRYEFLQATPPKDDLLGQGVPELVIDFKRYFTVPTDEVYFRIGTGNEAERRCYLNSPYLEHLSSRFFNYQQRIALEPGHITE